MRTFNVGTDIAAPSERVWEVMIDTNRWHEWTPSITSVKRLSDAPIAVGSRVLIRQPKIPPASWTVTAIEPGASFTWVSVRPGMRIVARHSVESVGDGSRATLSLELQGALGGLFGRMTRGITERYLALEARSENSGFCHGDTIR